ncbi:hypothetical protein [Emticicia sp. SJ17W-69]|uniref:hypothetical protein n=1 Tax=Emticicia sp. SJ17W-69 TaxID=3421657 RepID=UPI003EB97D90
MAQNIDDFFKKKTENIQDTLPENSAFDETLLWENIQQNLRKPKRLVGYWISAAACLVVLLTWWILPHPAQPNREGSSNSHPPVGATIAMGEKKKHIIHSEKQEKASSFKKNKTNIPRKLDFQIQSIASKKIEFSSENSNKLPDSLTFQSSVVFEKKSKMNFKTVHINEISKQEDAPFKQPRFKIQFATIGSIQTETNTNEIIKTPSIKTQ